MNQTDALIIIVQAMYESLGNNEKSKVVAEIGDKLTQLNKDTKTKRPKWRNPSCRLGPKNHRG